MKAIKKNFLPLLLALAVFLAVGRAAPTFAWLSAQSETVVNTFSAGAISLRLDEAKVDGNGQISGQERVMENNYRITPGAVLDKDPTVTVLAGSETCYVFLYVENTLPEEYFALDYSPAWIKAAQGSGGLYVYEAPVDTAQGDAVLPALFTKVTVSEALDEQTIADLGELTLKVQAYAVQYAGIAYEEALGMAEAYFQTQFALPDFAGTGAETNFEPEQPPETEADAPAEPVPEGNGGEPEPDIPAAPETLPEAGQDTAQGTDQEPAQTPDQEPGQAPEQDPVQDPLPQQDTGSGEEMTAPGETDGEPPAAPEQTGDAAQNIEETEEQPEPAAPAAGGETAAPQEEPPAGEAGPAAETAG